MNRAFFLDRDGTLNVDYDYVHTPEEWTWCEYAVDALRWIQEHRFKIIVITNQSGIVRSRYTEQQVQNLHRWVDKQLEPQNIYIDGWFYAPHHPEHDPDLNFEPEDRKPGRGMFKKAARNHNIDFSRSFMAGDKLTDLQPAVLLGITSIFIRSRHAANQNNQWLKEHAIGIYDTLWEAIQDISLREDRSFFREI